MSPPRTAPMALAAPSPTPTEGRPRRIGERFVRHAIVSAALALALALLLTLSGAVGPITLRGYAINFVYALCIGGAIQALQIGGLHALAAWRQRHHAAPPDEGGFWPGWHWFLPWLLVTTPLGYALGGGLADALTGGTHVVDLLGSSRRTIGFFATVTLIVSVLMGVGFVYYGRARSALARAQSLERQAAEHRLRLLESQLEPHMLFNTLANLQALIALDPPQAQAMLERLIAFLRGTLGGSLQRTHALADEFERIGDYLALMAVRMGPRLRFEMDLPHDLAQAAVPALLLQPLVENAIRHGLEPAVSGGTVRLAASRRPGVASGIDQLCLQVQDDGLGLPDPSGGAPAAGHGFGNRQVRERLKTLYGATATLVIGAGPDGRGTEAQVLLPLTFLPTDAPPTGAAPRQLR